MISKDSVSLSELVEDLPSSRIELEKGFLKTILVEASGSKTPWKSKEFAEKLGLTFNNKFHVCSTISSWANQKKAMQISVLNKILNNSKYSMTAIEKNVLSLRAGQKGGKIQPVFPIKFDKRLGSIVGHILGDGSIERHYSQISFSNSNKELLSEFYNNMLSIFGVKGRIWVQKRNKFEEKSEWLMKVITVNEVPKKHNASLFYPKICGKIINSMFGNFTIGKKKKITKEIKNAPDEFRKGMIRAFFDDEGSVGGSSYDIRVYQDNKKILTNIKQMIGDFDIATNKIKVYKTRGKARHYFSITSHADKTKFMKTIGFTSPLKRARLKKINKKVEKSNYFRLKQEKSKEVISELLN